jgi:hypothetical protein
MAGARRSYGFSAPTAAAQLSGRRLHPRAAARSARATDIRAKVRIGAWHDGATDHDHDVTRRWVARTTRHGVAASGRQPPLFRHLAGRRWVAMGGVVAATGEEESVDCVARISGPPLSYCDTRLVGVMITASWWTDPTRFERHASRMAPPAGRDDRTFMRYSSRTASTSRLPRPHGNVADGARNGRNGRWRGPGQQRATQTTTEVRQAARPGPATRPSGRAIEGRGQWPYGLWEGPV